MTCEYCVDGFCTIAEKFKLPPSQCLEMANGTHVCNAALSDDKKLMNCNRAKLVSEVLIPTNTLRIV